MKPSNTPTEAIRAAQDALLQASIKLDIAIRLINERDQAIAGMESKLDQAMRLILEMKGEN